MWQGEKPVWEMGIRDTEYPMTNFQLPISKEIQAGRLQAGLLTARRNKGRGEANSSACNGPAIKGGEVGGRRSFNKQELTTLNQDVTQDVQRHFKFA